MAVDNTLLWCIRLLLLVHTPTTLITTRRMIMIMVGAGLSLTSSIINFTYYFLHYYFHG